jgi:hypothetical protein
MTPPVLTVHQRLNTSGARAVEPFVLDGQLRMVVPQLATDIQAQPPHMNGGNSDIDARLYVWREGRFEDDGGLGVPGGEDAEFFTIDDDAYLATASLRTGRGPYDLNSQSVIYRWNGTSWSAFQSIPTFAAKQWRFFTVGERRFLALAQGVTIPQLDVRHPATSRIFEWEGTRFVEFQVLDGAWGYNFTHFRLHGTDMLAYADHAGASMLYRWEGSRFAPFQDFGPHGRAFAYFESSGESWLAFAPIVGESVLYRWDGATFLLHQPIGGSGGREFELVTVSGELFLVRICFITGTPAAPKPDLLSQLYVWHQRTFDQVAEFRTFGGTDVAAFHAGDALFLAVSNSLSRDVRYREDTVIYRCAP